jgi:hypothetical protein
MLASALFLQLSLMPQLATQQAASPCSLEDCLKRITSRVPVVTVELGAPDFVGVWSNGGGLSGAYLYVFDDSSYIATEWADILPETIFHKGTWRVVDGVVVLFLDADVTWREPGDRRFVLFRTKAKPDQLLFGLDFALHLFERLVRDQPRLASTWLELSSFKRRRQWKPGDPPCQ